MPQPAINYGIAGLIASGHIPWRAMVVWDETTNGLEMMCGNWFIAMNDNLTILAANEPPANTQNACVSLSAASPYVVKASAGTVYGVSSDKDVEVRDNATAKIICPSTFMKCPAPVSFGSNITIYSQIPALVTVWYV